MSIRDSVSVRPPAPVALTDAVSEELRRCLFEGRFRAGQVLRLRSLAEALGTSVQPVRDAVQRLVAEGAIAFTANRSLRVVHPSRASLAEIYRIRALLEGEATAMAARRGGVDIAAAEAAIEAMAAASRDGDTAAYSAANFAFHFGIYRAAGSFHLMPLIESLWLKVGPMLDIGPDGHSRAEMRLFEGQDAHRGLVAALRRGDVDGARAFLEEDLARGRDWFGAHHAFPPDGSGAIIRPLVPSRL